MKRLRLLIILLIAGIAGNTIAVSADSASGIRERKVDVGDGVLLRVIEAGQAGLAATLVLFPVGAPAQIFGDNRSIVFLQLVA